MIPYIVLFALVLLLPSVCKMITNKTERKLWYCVITFLAIILLVGMRHPTMGMDLPGYLKSFHRLHAMSWEEVFALDSYLNYEKGYILFSKLIAMLTADNEQIFLVVCCLLSTVPVAYTIFKKSQDALLSTVVYLGLPIFFIQYSALRQAIALGICFMALHLVEQKKFWWFLLAIFIATWFHYTSFVFIAAYVVYHIRISPKMRWGTLAALPLVFVFRSPLFTVLSLILKNNASISKTNAITMVIVFTLIYVFVILMFHSEDVDEKANGYMNIFYCACLCQIFSGVHSTAMRVGYFFMISLVLLLPMTVGRLKDDRIAWLVRWGIIAGFVWFAFDSIVGSSWAMAYPYRFFWQGATL